MSRTTRTVSLVSLLLVIASAHECVARAAAFVVELDDGTRQTGTLVAIDGRTIEIAAENGTALSLPVGKVRAIEGTPAPAAGRVRVAFTDGTFLEGEDFFVSGAGSGLSLPGGRAELPLTRVREVEFIAADPGARHRWLEAVPDGVTSDLVVVGKGAGYEFVECAIKAVSADSVTVVIDDETIPVRRSKVIGLRWLRGNSPAPGTVVRVTGGILRAETVAWTPAGLVLDGDDAERRTTLPAGALEGIDYAAGRTTHLATLPPERLDVDPFFGPLAAVADLAAYFAPRAVAADGQTATKLDLVMRPRTVATWRIPPQGRRLRMRLVQAAGPGPAALTIALDGRTVLQQMVSGEEAVPVDVDVAGARRLVVTVDFGPAGGMAGAVRLLEPAIEQ